MSLDAQRRCILQRRSNCVGQRAQASALPATGRDLRRTSPTAKHRDLAEEWHVPPTWHFLSRRGPATLFVASQSTYAVDSHPLPTCSAVAAGEARSSLHTRACMCNASTDARQRTRLRGPDLGGSALDRLTTTCCMSHIRCTRTTHFAPRKYSSQPKFGRMEGSIASN